MFILKGVLNETLQREATRHPGFTDDLTFSLPSEAVSLLSSKGEALFSYKLKGGGRRVNIYAADLRKTDLPYILSSKAKKSLGRLFYDYDFICFVEEGKNLGGIRYYEPLFVFGSAKELPASLNAAFDE
jgi:hypothetical protein